VAEQLEAGTTWINTHAMLGHQQPFLGRKWSGVGAENGLYSVAAYSDLHTIYTAKSGGMAYVPKS
jgi:acyl-CoA reductase-like NAD-dependent aldehyde dehydrogenase